MRCAAIVVAGGSGRRFGGLKQFAELRGLSVAARSIAACRAVADHVVLVTPEGMELDAHGADQVVTGGESRSDSVRAGLACLDQSVEVVVIHDAARPLALEELFHAVVDEITREGTDGAIVGLEVTDTIKQVSGVGGRRPVVATPERDSLVTVQTPQAFRASALRRAHAAERDATDDAALLEMIGSAVVVVPGDLTNIKLTTPEDLDQAIRILEARE
jgi:2-C-methyl-D-erythritol 4-phosphate cytidylyltransferase